MFVGVDDGEGNDEEEGEKEEETVVNSTEKYQVSFLILSLNDVDNQP